MAPKKANTSKSLKKAKSLKQVKPLSAGKVSLSDFSS